jgi:hypothetical protein
VIFRAYGIDQMAADFLRVRLGGHRGVKADQSDGYQQGLFHHWAIVTRRPGS